MNATMLASNLGFPEGPVVMSDSRIVFCDGNIGELLVWDGEQIGTYATTGGSPWGAILGTDGCVYVCQGGDVPGSGTTGHAVALQNVADGGRRTCLSVNSPETVRGGSNADLAGIQRVSDVTRARLKAVADVVGGGFEEITLGS